MNGYRVLPILSLAVLAASAAAQQTPVQVPDSQARGKTGVWTNLSVQSQAAVLGEATASVINATSTVTINSITHWSGSFKYGTTGKVYPYTMIGTHPFKDPISTTIPVVLIPLRFVFDAFLVNGKPLVFDPAAKLGLLKASPLWATHNYGFGSAQYIDALQRDSFARTNGYHVLLGTPKILATHVVHVPSGSGLVSKTNTGYVGVVDTNFLLNLISTLPHTLGVQPNELAVMASYDVYGGSIPPSGFYYYGFHGNTEIASTTTSVTVQLWAWSSWIDPGWFANPGTIDIIGFTHEVAELANDPFLNNFVPYYLFPYSSTSCNNILEVGDVTEGLTSDSHATSVNGYTYHPANVAMIPWFSRTSASTTTRSYSFPGTTVLTTPSKPCL